MAASPLLLLAVLTAATPEVGEISARGVQLEEVLTVPPSGGTADSERVVEASVPGCPGRQTLWLSRAVSLAADAGEHAYSWLLADPKRMTRLFRSPGAPLVEAVRRARESRFELPPECVQLGSAGALGTMRACGANPAAAARATRHVFSTAKPAAPAGRVVVLAGPAKLCEPSVEVVLEDAAGRPRAWFVATQTETTGWILGERCQALQLSRSAGQAGLGLHWSRDPRCKR